MEVLSPVPSPWVVSTSSSILVVWEDWDKTSVSECSGRRAVTPLESRDPVCHRGRVCARAETPDRPTTSPPDRPEERRRGSDRSDVPTDRGVGCDRGPVSGTPPSYLPEVLDSPSPSPNPSPPCLRPSRTGGILCVTQDQTYTWGPETSSASRVTGDGPSRGPGGSYWWLRRISGGM